MSDTRICFAHLRPKNESKSPKGGITLAFIEEEDQLHYSAAICSLSDNFNKKIGRAISSGRLKKGIFMSTNHPGHDANFKDIIKHLAEDFKKGYAEVVNPNEVPGLNAVMESCL